MNKLFSILTALFLLTGISSCVKETYDTPKTGGTDPNITVNFSIDSVKARWTPGQPAIQDDRVISGIVTADDKSGTFYKQIVIQDSTGAIVLALEASSIYNDYPIFRQLLTKYRSKFNKIIGIVPIITDHIDLAS